MTPGVSLCDWERLGILSREIKPIRAYIERGWNVKVISYGPAPEWLVSDRLTVVSLRHPRELFLPNRFKELDIWADVLRTNQSRKCYYFVAFAILSHKPILLRCGYVHGEYLESTVPGSAHTKFYMRLEAWAFRRATGVCVPTEQLKRWVEERYKCSPNRVTLLPNYIDSDKFFFNNGCIKNTNDSVRIISIGRLESVKRFDLLVKSCARIEGAELTIVGEGRERGNLEALASSFGVKLNMPGIIPHDQLPGLLRSQSVYVMTSLREGHPKALIEAMACGLPCVVTKGIGIDDNSDFASYVNFAEPEEDSIANTICSIKDLMLNPSEIHLRGAEFAANRYGFTALFEKEYRFICKLSKGK